MIAITCILGANLLILIMSCTNWLKISMYNIKATSDYDKLRSNMNRIFANVYKKNNANPNKKQINRGDFFVR